jgi:hypothetical protein
MWFDNSTARDNGPAPINSPSGDEAGAADMGMIGFDIACETARSGPRMQSYLVNDLCKNIVANKKAADFALAA